MDDLPKAKSKKEKEALEQKLRKEQVKAKGHAKEMDQKWPGWDKELDRAAKEFEDD